VGSSDTDQQVEAAISRSLFGGLTSAPLARLMADAIRVDVPACARQAWWRAQGEGWFSSILVGWTRLPSPASC